MPKRTLIVAVVVAAVVLTSTAAWAAGPPYPVVDEPKVEESAGTRAAGWTGWSQFTKKNRTVAFLKPDSGPRLRIPTRRAAFIGGMQLSGPRTGQAVFYQYTPKLRGVIRFFDPVSGEIKRAPKGINQKRWSQKSATISGQRLLFGRGRPNRGFQRLVMVYNFNSRKVTRLVGATVARFNADQVRGDFATWTTCVKNTCHVTRHRFSTKNRVRMPVAAATRANRSGAVTEDGTVYYIQSGYQGCGNSARIMKYDGATGDESIVWTFNDGIQPEDLFAWNDGAQDRVTFTRTVCSTLRRGIWEIVP